LRSSECQFDFVFETLMRRRIQATTASEVRSHFFAQVVVRVAGQHEFVLYAAGTIGPLLSGVESVCKRTGTADRLAVAAALAASTAETAATIAETIAATDPISIDRPMP
jgi:hypothetical protein